MASPALLSLCFLIQRVGAGLSRGVDEITSQLWEPLANPRGLLSHYVMAAIMLLIAAITLSLSGSTC